MADQLHTTGSTSAPSALGSEARHVSLNRSHSELHSVALAPDHALGSQLNSDAVDFGCVRENVACAARDGQHEMVAIVETAQGSMKATSSHGRGAVGDVVHCTAECGKSSASSVAADQLLTAAMVHVFALAGFAAGIATLWAISRACRAARNGLRWCWRRCAHG
ncbi:hypothetical protein [Stenotrophomonas maltophilia group sp. LNF259]